MLGIWLTLGGRVLVPVRPPERMPEMALCLGESQRMSSPISRLCASWATNLLSQSCIFRTCSVCDRPAYERLLLACQGSQVSYRFHVRQTPDRPTHEPLVWSICMVNTFDRTGCRHPSIGVTSCECHSLRSLLVHKRAVPLSVFPLSHEGSRCT